MDILETNLSAKQKEVIAKVQNAHKEKLDVLIVTGEAGSGKTTLISHIFNKPGIFKDTYAAALTGRAANVLRDKGIHEAMTIQSLVSGRPKFNWLSKFKFLQKLTSTKTVSNNENNKIFIFDEASMITDSLDKNSSWQNRDGLTQLERIEKVVNVSGGYQLILMVGDKNQLPPPVENTDREYTYSNALSKTYWEKKGYRNVEAMDLGTTHRQDEDTSLLKFAREIIDVGTEAVPNVDDETISLVGVDNAYALHTFLKYYEKDPLQVKWIVSSNYGVAKNTDTIRKELFQIEPTTHINKDSLTNLNIQKDEPILVSKNNTAQSIDIFNGDILKIKKIKSPQSIPITIKKITDSNEDSKYKERIDSDLFKRRFPEKKENEIKYYLDFNSEQLNDTEDTITRTLVFADVTFEQVHATRSFKKTFTALTLLNSFLLPKVGTSNAINVEEQILETCMMEHLIERNPHKPQEEISNIITEDKYFNAVWATWGYVMTAHKAQGGEWDTILADFREGYSNNASWQYTAVTRARKKLYINASEGLLNIGKNIYSDAKQNTLPKKLLDIVENLSEEEKNLLIKSIENKKIEKEEKNSDIHTYTKEEALMLAEKLPIPDPSTWAEHRKVNPRYQAKWSLEEDNIIISLIKSGMSVIEISKVLKRNTGAIGAKWQKLHENNIVEMNDDDLKRYGFFSRKKDHNEESIYNNFDEDTPF